MEELDLVRLDFDSSQLWLMNLCLAFIMFGIALDLKLRDFRLLYTQTRWVIICLVAQLIMLPLMTYFFIKVVDPLPSITLGLIMVASCPGGNISNYFTHLAGGNTALSIALTSFVTMFSFLFTPMVFGAMIWLLKMNEGGAGIYLDPLEVSKTVVTIIVIPLALGLWVHERWGNRLHVIRIWIRRLSLLIFGLFIFFALKDNVSLIREHLTQVFSIVAVHNILALFVGWSMGRIFFVDPRNRRTITIETGIQNAGMGLILIFNYFPHLGGMALIAAFWGIWDMISGLLLSLYWKYQRIPSENIEIP